MKKNSYIVVTFIVLIFGIWALPKIVNKLSKEALVKFEKVPAFKFTDQNNKNISNKNFEGKVYVVEFFFTSCPSICPKMNRQMQRVYAKYKSQDDFRILSFTVNPEVDSVEAMNAYAKEHEAGSRWHFLTGNKDRLYALARKSFFVLKPAEAENMGDANSDFIHTNNFVLIDKLRRIRGYYDGTKPESVDSMMVDIGRLLRE